MALSLSTSAWADITIGGKVYGGGKQGAVGTGNAAVLAEDVNDVTMKSPKKTATEVTINSGDICAVFGGGENGRSYGITSVNIKGGSIGVEGNADSANGNVFAAGDGSSAIVFGGSVLTVTGGTVKQNAYGGGNEANLIGTTTVNLKGGTFEHDVYGGAKIADIFGRTFVNIDGDKASGDLAIANVYGGNDISGNVSPATNNNWSWAKQDNLNLPFTLAENVTGVDKSWNAFILATASEAHTVKIDNLYGGGNGDYDYTTAYAGKNKPEIAKTYLQILGGVYGSLYGGGNAATVTESTDICLLNADTHNYIDTYQFDRVFGGNNQAAMNIRPNWYLQQARINNLYSGGNAGDMTHPEGILLAVTGNDMTINNVYGGCRMADVNPDKNTFEAKTFNIAGKDYSFPANHAARVLVTGGRINYVYGGNDISGNVYGGNAVDIRSSIIKDVYGGGNGSYPYTDQSSWVTAHPEYADYLYSGDINDFRPNTESVWLHVSGTDATHPTYIGGGLYCGGNSATLKLLPGSKMEAAKANLSIGSHVIAKNVFLGSNGENMVKTEMLQLYATEGFSSLNLKNSTDFETYMHGCEVSIKPDVAFDEGYTEYTSMFESVFCGGNVGSMSANDYFDLSFLKKLVIYDKLVGGCNNANVAESDYNAAHEGGLITQTLPNKVILNIEGVQFEPKTLTYNSTDNTFSVSAHEEDGYLKGGNIYGGCYASGYVNGGVQINIGQNAIRSTVSGTSTHNLDDHRDYLFNTALSAFGGGYGAGTEIKGNTTVNISGEGNILKVFGGGEMGKVSGNTTINVTGGTAGKVYGGGYEGLVTGNTIVKLDGGTVYDAIAGACNADINGYAQMLLGTNGGTTTVQNNVYGGNDFGGSILSAQENTANGTDKVTSNTYVLYKKGSVAGNIFGGACGSYDYSVAPYSTKAGESGFAYPKFDVLPTAITEGDIVANSFVDIQTSNADADKVTHNIYGGGCGYLNAKKDGNQLAIVDMKQTYVLLRGNNKLIADNILAGGYYSKVDNTRLDAYTGKANKLFGGTFGATAADAETSHMDAAVSYSCTDTEVNLFAGLDAEDMDVFGAGSYAGAATTHVNLYGGKLNDIYGGSYNEGVCTTTNVIIPDASNTMTSAASTASINRVFGGSYGMDNNLPCDVLTSNVTYSSASAYVAEGVFGGNNNARATKVTNVNINVAALTSATGGQYISVYGAGNGANSVAGYTHVNLNNASLVRNVYGGGNMGKVYGAYDDKVKAPTYYATNEYAHWAYTAAFTDDTWGTKNNGVDPNTSIVINPGATVQNVYGAGYGQEATVCGNTYVKLNGGTVSEDIFGGGFAGNVLAQTASDLGTTTVPANQDGNLYTYVNIHGGNVRNVYGGGYNGNVGNDSKSVETRVEIGTDSYINHQYNAYADGNPAVRRSVYGGGFKGAVIGTAKVNMNNGYVGYEYAGTDAETGDGIYNEHLNVSGSTAKLLRDNGNVYGGGYGEGATTDHTVVNMYGGTIRNSLYGGGEIASVGRAVLSTINVNDRSVIPDITTAGSTEVNMYGGLVTNNVFGGGRGYAIDAYGNTATGEESYSDGYTFGKTLVNIYRGTVGTDASLKDGNGNVFGGGNIGYVYAADDRLTAAKKNVYRDDERDGYYHSTYDNLMTEDCMVVVTPYARNTTTGAYSSCNELNNVTDWTPYGDLDLQGIVIRNAVFAGGNVSAGSDKVYANTVTVYGNATASVIDCIKKDLITMGADEIGGLYGDGNLTFVDGYRELNITNYGTDYYSLGNELTLEEYQKLNSRERAYFELKYVCQQTYTSSNGKTYTKKDQITGSEYDRLDEDEKDALTTHKYWVLNGFCTLYAGRLMNTIQRADFCGVFGSRLVLKGAQDRVPSVVDYTKYTINRIGELSLNQVNHGNTAINDGVNGNYFGIYNVVNLLGAVTSDVELTHTRTTDSETYIADGKTYGQYKQENLGKRNRNNATSKNKIALASGVWLEIVKEYATEDGKIGNFNYKAGEKVYGPITGVVELDLINASTGEGGGYVYALNEHGAVSPSGAVQTTLTASNLNAHSYKQYSYATPTEESKMETSGNFVNGVKRIIDDCYPTSGSWLAETGSSAHYWFVRGELYVYDQYISAYTGSAQSYAKSVNVPLTITAESQGRLKLINVQQNLNAFWTDNQYSKLDDEFKLTGDDGAVVFNGNTYHQNTPISYWDWTRLTDDQRAFFTFDTYVCNVAVGDYTKGQALTKAQYEDAIASEALNGKYLVQADIKGTTYKDGDLISTSNYNSLSDSQKENCILAKDCFNVTNGVTSDNGFLLTFDWDNPEKWNDWYIQSKGQDMKMKKENPGSTYIIGPTFTCTNTKDTEAVYGQTSYTQGDIINDDEYNRETEKIRSVAPANSQAQFAQAYVALHACSLTIGAGENAEDYNFVKGSAISDTFYNSLTTEQKTNFQLGYVCTETYQVSDDKYYINGDIIPSSEYTNVIQDKFSPMYICTTSGSWGGKLYIGGQNYEAIDYCNLSDAERANFSYNIDAFDVLAANSTSRSYTDMSLYTLSTDYSGLSNYKSRHTDLYGAQTTLDYTATYNDVDNLVLTGGRTVAVIGKTEPQSTITKGDKLRNSEFESLINERSKYAGITIYKNKYVVNEGETVTSTNGTVYNAGESVSYTVYGTLQDSEKSKITPTVEDCDYYVVNTEFWVGDKWYGVGSTVTKSQYDELGDNKTKVTEITGSDLRSKIEDGKDMAEFYFCKETYKAVTAFNDVASKDHAVGSDIAVGTVLNYATYTGLQNEQVNFEIDGVVPTETSTFYVARATDINSLSEDRICTVIYEYNYIESNDDGTAYENIKERHIVNIHIHFESGVPMVGELLEPSAVLPGTSVGLNQPSVTKGAYEILGGGWEIYTSKDDATNHKNGADYINNNTKAYWYQDGYHVAYYAKSYLGKTYSNSVPITVANYHRMADVLNSKHKETVLDEDGNPVVDATSGENVTKTINDYMYINEAANDEEIRNAKIYIKNSAELDAFALFIGKTLNPGENDDLSAVLRGGNRIDFIIDGDINHEGTWTSIASGTDECFSGTLHGDGHTISNMDNSLLNHLCGDVYNLGVTGSFAGAGIAETGDGYVENCWVATTASALNADTRAVFGNPSRENGTQVVNCYYPETNSGYLTTDNGRGIAKAMTVQSFVNGEVAYNLNGFYLGKRYYDANPTTSGAAYKYWSLNYQDTDNNESTPAVLTGTLLDGNYPAGYNNYVEDRYSNADFLYSNGMIPQGVASIREYLASYYPVYPDDYIFFGQKLNFNASTHGVQPATIIKTVAKSEADVDNRLIVTESTGNRVYRAPAYYQNSTMSTAHFNMDARFQATYTTPGTSIWGAKTVNVNKGMTAVDFTGNGDTSWNNGWSGGIFNKKVLDYDGLNSFNTTGITRNLLIYAPADLNEVLNTNSTEPEYAEDEIADGNDYRRVAKVAEEPKWHIVNKTDAGYVAQADHFLVDKQDFNAPISYTFAEGKRMWYQRTPETYAQVGADGTMEGWEGISLPFAATLVTTQEKGEITHFYSGSTTGHEYWLREYAGIATAKDAENNDITVANMNNTAAASASRTVSNSFLWDYYYNADGKDDNEDVYQTYYNESRDYSGQYEVGTPYVIGFPGSSYYEFDLSGTFVPSNSGSTTPDKLAKQVITFASAPAISIAVSDDEQGTTESGYTFKTNYLGASGVSGYFLNSNGSAFENAVDAENNANGVSVPFRPYITVASQASPAPAATKAAPGKLFIGNSDSESNESQSENGGSVKIWSENNNIWIENRTANTVSLTVFTSGGQAVKRVRVKPMEKSFVPVSGRGIYMVGGTKVVVK